MVYYTMNNHGAMIWESNILLKYILGKCDQVEKVIVHSWLEESDQNENTLAYLRTSLNRNS